MAGAADRIAASIDARLAEAAEHTGHAAKQVGEVLSVHIISRPTDDTVKILNELLKVKLP